MKVDISLAMSGPLDAVPRAAELQALNILPVELNFLFDVFSISALLFGADRACNIDQK